MMSSDPRRRFSRFHAVKDANLQGKDFGMQEKESGEQGETFGMQKSDLGMQGKDASLQGNFSNRDRTEGKQRRHTNMWA